MAGKKHRAEKKNIRGVISAGRKNKVTLIEGPLTRRQVSLEEITSRTEFTIEFNPPVNPSTAYDKVEDGREVFILEKGSDAFLHGTFVRDTEVSGHYGIKYFDSTITQLDLHDYRDLRKVYFCRSALSGLFAGRL